MPHPEIDLILVNGTPISFEHIIENAAEIDVHGTQSRTTFFTEHRLQVTSITRFIADVHLGKLTANLRLLGFDVAYHPDLDDRELLTLMQAEDRALLSRDRRLLMHRIVRHAFLPRSQQPLAQTIEVLRRFDLENAIRPFTRCIHCNGLLEPVSKADVFAQLEPLTKLYYAEFRRCRQCRRVYWRGSHFDKLQGRVDEIRAQLGPS